MTDAVAKKMSEASANEPAGGTVTNPPRKGERFRCQKCGMEVEVTADCHCKSGEHVQLRCCGQDLVKV